MAPAGKAKSFRQWFNGAVLRGTAASLALLLAIPTHASARDAGNWFLGAAAGWQSFDGSLDVDQGDVALLFDPDDEGSSLGLRVGYRLNPRWFATAEYQRVDADDTEIDNWYLSINHRWQLSADWSWSLGLLAGASTLDWQDAPIATVNRDRESDDFLWGVQAGLTTALGQRWQLELRYQFLAPEHNSRLEPFSGRGRYTHEEFHHFAIGVDFRF